MKRVGAPLHGYTIIEVMIFLAVSGVMFLIAATFINGKQANAEFTQATGDIRSRLQQVIDNVVNGYYPTQENFSCSSGGVGLSFSGSGSPQGTNGDCVYLGEVVQFGVSGTQGEGYAVIPVVGSRTTGGAAPQVVTSFSQARPTPLTNDFTNGHADMVDSRKLFADMRVTKMYLMPGSHPISGFGIFTPLGSIANGSLQSGSQDIMLVSVPGLGYTDMGSYIEGRATEGTGTAASADITHIQDGNILTNDQSVVMCFKGGNDKPASITLGGQGGQVSVGIKTGQDVAGVCPT